MLTINYSSNFKGSWTPWVRYEFFWGEQLCHKLRQPINHHPIFGFPKFHFRFDYCEINRCQVIFQISLLLSKASRLNLMSSILRESETERNWLWTHFILDAHGKWSQLTWTEWKKIATTKKWSALTELIPIKITRSTAAQFYHLPKCKFLLIIFLIVRIASRHEAENSCCLNCSSLFVIASQGRYENVNKARKKIYVYIVMQERKPATMWSKYQKLESVS